LFSHLSCTSCFLVFSYRVLIFESYNIVLFLIWKLDLDLFLSLCSCGFCVLNKLALEWLCLICDYFATTIIFAPLCCVCGLGLDLLMHLNFFVSLVISSTLLFDSPRCLISCCKSNHHYEKLHPSKPHYLATKTQKTIHIQLFCNYLLGITSSVQLTL
jgi:hypothetical protein